MPEDVKSVFNAGVALAERLDQLQRGLNLARFNLLDINVETKTYNYEVAFECLNGLMMEAWAKADVKNEQKDLLRIKTIIRKFIDRYPPVRFVKRNQKDIAVVDKINLATLSELLTIYERRIKEVLDAHDLNSPNKDMDDDDEL